MHLERMYNQSLVRDVTVVLVLKIAALVVLYAMFFSPHHRPPADVRALFEGAANRPSVSR